MSSPQFEAFLARLYTDEQFRVRFIANARAEADRANLSKDECAALEKIDRVGLEIAARSFAKKREQKASTGKKWFERLFGG
jgi:hypothetical protein